MDRRGLTLLESLLALTILSMAGAVVYSSLSTTLLSWRKGVNRGREHQTALVALDRIAGQLKSAVPAVVEGEGGPAAAFAAGEDFIRFVTLLPVSGRPMAQVSYAVEEREGKEVLVYREHPWPDKKFSEGGGDPWMEEEITGISGMTVLPRVVEEDDGSALPRSGREEAAWQAGEEKELPDEVEVSLRLSGPGEGGEEPYRTVVPIMAGPFLAGR